MRTDMLQQTHIKKKNNTGVYSCIQRYSLLISFITPSHCTPISSDDLSTLLSWHDGIVYNIS